MGNKPHMTHEELLAQVYGLEQRVAEQESTIAEKSQVIERQKIRIEYLSQSKFGRSSERRSRTQQGDGCLQGDLFHAELIAEADRTAELKHVQGEITLAPPKKPKKRGGRRKKLPDHLPTVTTRYELEDDQRQCGKCGSNLHVMGKETTRELERLESAIVHIIEREKYGCRCCEEEVVVAPGPDRVIDKGILGPGFLSSIAFERFGNHMPYNRLEKKYATEGLDLSRSVMERSMARCAEILAPIAGQLRKDVLAQDILFTDDTGVTVARPSTGGGSKRGHVWIYLTLDGKHFYDFTIRWTKDGPATFLKTFKGWMHADGYPGYIHLYREGQIREVSCWAHVRRYFIRAEEAEPEIAAEAIERIGQLFQVEREARDRELPSEQRLELRKQYSAVIAEELFAWLATKQLEVLPKSPMGEAIAYALKRESGLKEYLKNGRLCMDNNAAERALRAVAIGRKNWMFFQNEAGAKTATVMFSLVMSAKAAGINPQVYLRDVLLRIARETDVTKLTPHGWKEHFAEEVEADRMQAMGAYIGD